MSIILGIDPGSRVTGFGVIRMEGDALQSICFGVIKMDETASFADRLQELGVSLRPILQKYKPDSVAIEKIFLGKNADSAFKLGHARGVIMYESACFGAKVFEYATRIVKKGVTGKGNATKEDVQMMLQRLLKLKTIQHLDASDALALAVHHAYAVRTHKTLRRAAEVDL